MFGSYEKSKAHFFHDAFFFAASNEFISLCMYLFIYAGASLFHFKLSVGVSYRTCSNLFFMDD